MANIQPNGKGFVLAHGNVHMTSDTLITFSWHTELAIPNKVVVTMADINVTAISPPGVNSTNGVTDASWDVVPASSVSDGPPLRTDDLIGAYFFLKPDNGWSLGQTKVVVLDAPNLIQSASFDANPVAWISTFTPPRTTRIGTPVLAHGVSADTTLRVTSSNDCPRLASTPSIYICPGTTFQEIT